MAFANLRKRYNNLFFVKRTPMLHFPIEYERPKDSLEYEKSLENEGFISRIAWKEDDISRYKTLNQDLNELEEHLMPVFWEFNQKALHYQNRFYFYQWVFMLGAFLTTVAGAVTTYAYTFDGDGNMATKLAGLITAIISAVTAYFNVLSDQGSPQKRWAKARRLTEELRTTYFTFLAHLSPFDTQNRVQELRKLVIAIRRKENENV